MTLSRRLLLSGMLAATIASAFLFPTQATRRPNILFILADDLGYGDLGCYGQKIIRTPNIDRLAEEGVRFTDCYAGSTVCAPSRCALMTGLHTGHCHVRGNARIPLRLEDVTVAQLLRDAGYRTGLIGKWGLGEPGTSGIPNRQGFDDWFGYLNQRRAHNYYIDYLWENEKKFHLPGNQGGKIEEYSHDLFTERALKFIQDNQEVPFFLYLAYTIPHANNELGGETGDGMEVPDYGPYSEKDWPTPQKGHAAMISRMDRDVGRIMKLLEQLGLDEDTIVFFTSDNGPHKEGGADPAFFNSWGPLRGYKRDLYEGGIRVPMIVRWKGRIEPKRESHQVWAFWDFLPTAADIAGVEAPEGIDGISVIPSILRGETQDHPPLYWEFHERSFKQAVRLGDWKGVRIGIENSIELYDLAKDLGEERNVAPNHPEMVSEMERLFKSQRTPSKHWPVPGFEG